MEKEKFDFGFYVKFTKPLVLNLPCTRDRILASAWVKLLVQDAKIEDPVKLEYLKLLLFVLQRKTLVPPFTQHPAGIEKLEEIPKDKTLVDVAKELLAKEHEERQAEKLKPSKDDSKKWPPYICDFSADQLEYVSIQTIDNFGVHGYYAISKEPLPMWERVEKELLPKVAKSMLEVSPPPPSFLDSPARSTPQLPEKSPEKSPEKPQEPPPPVDIPPVEQPEEPPSDIEEVVAVEPKPKTPKRKSPYGSKPPSRPLGKVSPPAVDDREPPSWGSNLLEPNVLDDDIGDLIRDMTNLEQLMPEPESDAAAAAPLEVIYQGDGGAPPPSVAKRGPKKPRPFVKQTRSSMLRQKMEEEEPPPPPRRKPARKPSKKRLAKPKPTAGGGVDDAVAGFLDQFQQQEMTMVEQRSPKRRVEEVEDYGGEDDFETLELMIDADMRAEGLDPYEKGGIGYDDMEAMDRRESLDERLRRQQMSLEEDDEVPPPRTSPLRQVMEQQPPSPLPPPAKKVPRKPGAYVKQTRSSMLRQKMEEEEEPPPPRRARKPPQKRAPAVPSPAKVLVAVEPPPPPPPVAKKVPKKPRVPVRQTRSSRLRHSMEEEEPPPKVKPAKKPSKKRLAEPKPTAGGGVDDALAGFLDKFEQEKTLIEQRSPRRRTQDEDEDDFEAMERRIEAEMIAQGLDPHEKGGIGYDDMEAMDRRESLDERIQRQQMRLEEESEGDDDDFEAMERQIEAEMIAQGQDPHEKGGIGYDDMEAMDRRESLDQRIRRQQMRLEEEEPKWEDAGAYLAESDKRYFKQLPVGLQVKQVFPGMEEEGDFELDAEILPSDFVAEQEAKDQETIREYLDYSPKLSPRTQAYYDKEARRYLSSALPDYQSPVKFATQFPPSPPRTEEELRPIPSDMEEVTSRYPPETFQFQYETPPRQHQTLRSPAAIDTSQISPENKLWWTDFRNMQKSFHGSPKKTVPDFFDLPQLETLDAASPPRDWASPVSPHTSPVDLERLKHDSYKKHRKPGGGIRPYSKVVGGTRINRYSIPSPMAHREIIPEEAEPPPYFTWEDEDLRDSLRQHEMVTDERNILFPYRNVKRLRGKKATPLRSLREVYESPEKKHPDVIDLVGRSGYRTPPLSAEGLPPGFASPVSPHIEEIDTEQLGREVREGAVTPVYGYGRRKTGRGRAQEGRPTGGVTRSRGRRPQLGYVSEAMEGMDESEWAHLGKMSAAPGRLPPKDFPIRVSRAPGLGQLPSSPIEYPDSPLARRPAPESPTHVGPQRRTLRKRLKKRRLDFDEEPTDFDESEVVEVDTTVEDRYLSPPPHKYGEKLSPSRVHHMRRLYGLSPPRPYEMSPPPGTPKTPPRPTGIMEEEMPEVEGGLPELLPASPMSEYGVLEGVMAEVRAHVPYTPSPPDTHVSLRQEWKRRPGKHLRKVKEVPLEEEIYRIHEGVEAEVDEELAAKAAAAAARRAAEASILDEPIPGGLGSPMRPPVAVPFYQTPPHLKHSTPITRRYDPEVAKTANLLFGLQPSLREQEKAEMDEFERFERAIEMGVDLGIETPITASPRQRTPPPMYILPPAARMVVDRTAQRQYEQLRTPPQTFEQFYDKIRALPISPLQAPLLTEPGATTLEYEQTIREKPKGAGAPKLSKWARAPKMAPRQLRKTLKQQQQQPPPQPPAPPAAAAAAAAGGPRKARGPPKRKVREPLIKRKPLYQPPAPKEKPSDKSLKSVKSKTSATSVKSTGSAKSVTRKKKSKYDVPSKLDTGRKKPKATKKEPHEIKVTMSGLADLGLTDADLQNANVVEARPASPSIAEMASEYIGLDRGIDDDSFSSTFLESPPPSPQRIPQHFSPRQIRTQQQMEQEALARQQHSRQQISNWSPQQLAELQASNWSPQELANATDWSAQKLQASNWSPQELANASLRSPQKSQASNWSPQQAAELQASNWSPQELDDVTDWSAQMLQGSDWSAQKMFDDSNENSQLYFAEEASATILETVGAEDDLLPEEIEAVAVADATVAEMEDRMPWDS